jgi:uncharacterized LabA/DUF88 family protein
LQRFLDSQAPPSDTANIPRHGYIPWLPRGCDPGGFFISEANVNRAAFLVDGFNLAHSVRDGERVAGRSLSWLDVAGLCAAHLHALPGPTAMGDVYYFSALAHHLEARRPGLVARQATYFSALRATGVALRLARFKGRDITCPRCGSRFRRYEEKETDVAIGVKMVEIACRGGCDTLALVSGDSDLVPAAEMVRAIAPRISVAVMFPYRRANDQLRRLAARFFTLKAAAYARHQLPDVVRAADGEAIRRPVE